MSSFVAARGAALLLCALALAPVVRTQLAACPAGEYQSGALPVEFNTTIQFHPFQTSDVPCVTTSLIPMSQQLRILSLARPLRVVSDGY